MPNCDSDCMNIFLRELSRRFPEDHIPLRCDGAAWHNSKALQVPANIALFHIPPYTPEMNPIEQIWRELRCQGFQNEIFSTLENVVERLCGTIGNLTAQTIRSITARQWIVRCFK
ncbi:transposase [Pyramidobacter piscolens W5455]|uniref:Transposase n=2 Tax=Pyramidobacter piscolens TaxID=638849 RepID=A0ABM9ZVW4_9BACT|nr:transposase [Pyramidobacter piscolens W5455]